VRNVARLLLDGYEGPLGERQHAAVVMMRQSADGLAQLVDDWLDLAKIEAGKIVVRTAEFDLSALFGVLRGVFRPLATSPDVTLTFEESHDIKLLYTDEGKVSQILRNLVSNALKFTQRGHVTVTAASGEDDVISIRVSDSGIGIALADLERVFEEFAQVESAVQTRLKGTGLGLPISRKLARLIHGDILVESVLDAGTTFTLIFPRIYLDPKLVGADLAAAGLSEHA
jgi:signal transduction histidine kinase